MIYQGWEIDFSQADMCVVGEIPHKPQVKIQPNLQSCLQSLSLRLDMRKRVQRSPVS